MNILRIHEPILMNKSDVNGWASHSARIVFKIALSTHAPGNEKCRSDPRTTVLNFPTNRNGENLLRQKFQGAMERKTFRENIASQRWVCTCHHREETR